MITKLVNPSDEELNAAFAEGVAGWKMQAGGPGAFGGNVNPYWQDEKGIAQFDGPWFAYSADAILPWLEKTGQMAPALWIPRARIEWHPLTIDAGQFGKHTRGWLVDCGEGAKAKADTLPKAAVIAILRAYGAEVEFTA